MFWGQRAFDVSKAMFDVINIIVGLDFYSTDSTFSYVVKFSKVYGADNPIYDITGK